MPYIKQYLRDEIENGSIPIDAGQLNYVITSLCNLYLEEIGKTYTSINEVVGVLECAKLELYRRIAAPYEDEKIKENGDVYSV
jgi:hypothetical protein